MEAVTQCPDPNWWYGPSLLVFFAIGWILGFGECWAFWKRKGR